MAEPVVPPDEYDHDYYLYSCIGADTWRESGGTHAKGLYHGMLQLAGIQPGMALLDIGTGRGEMLIAALDRGAAKAVGVDYSAAAIELCKTTLRQAGDPPQAEAILADARGLPVEAGAFDLVTLADVVEHLSPAELALALAQASRALRPGGRLFIHTAPNRYVYDITYRFQRLAVPWRMRSWPKDPRSELERKMHVNEQTIGGLARTLRDAGFVDVEVRLGQWLHVGHIPASGAKKTYYRLARLPVLRQLAIFDMFAAASRPSSS